MNCFIYARVSTKDKGQDPDNQLELLREYARTQGWTVTGEFVDLASGVKRRPSLERMWGEVRAGAAGIVLCYRFDRIARSTRELLATLDECNSLGVRFVSRNEQLDTGTPMGQFVFTVLAGIAQLERSITAERVRDSVRRVRASGKQWGAKPQFSRAVMRQLKAEGLANREIARQLHCSHQTVNRAFSV